MAIVNKIQDAGNTGVSLSSINVTLTNPTGVSNGLIACVGTLTATVSSITGGGTWVSANSTSTAGLNLEMWVAPNVSDGVKTITVNLSGADAIAVNVSEYSGL